MRLPTGVDLRCALEQVVAEHGVEAGFELAGIGNLWPALLPPSGAEEISCLGEDLALLILSGNLAAAGSHPQLNVSRYDGCLLGGHAAHGCIVRTTAGHCWPSCHAGGSRVSTTLERTTTNGSRVHTVVSPVQTRVSVVVNGSTGPCARAV